MKSRIKRQSELQGPRDQMLGLETYLGGCSLDQHLLDLVRMRVSQINGCAFCLDMHARDLSASGEREERLYVLSSWRETAWFNARERAALAWAEAITTLANQEVPDEIFATAREQFSERELGDLTLAIIAINGWNRINIGFQIPPPSIPELVATD